MPRRSSSRHRVKPALGTAVPFVFLTLVALMGGSARTDVVSLLLLRPVAVVMAGWAVLRLTGGEMRPFRHWLYFFAAVAAVLLIQLVPLPQELWSALPLRDIVVDIDRATGRGAVWRPFTLDPQLTRNALWSLAVPLCALALAIKAGTGMNGRLLLTIPLTGICSGLLGVVQFAGGIDSPLYLYRISNFGSAVGLFANRNHEGVFLAMMFPLLAGAVVLARSDRSGKMLRLSAGAMALLLIPMILTTGSRAGLLIGALGLASGAALLRPHLGGIAGRGRAPRSRVLVAVALALGFIVFCAIYIGFNPGNSLDRLVGSSSTETELRVPIWRTTWDIITAVFPWGTGFGAFPLVFQVFEPDAMLAPAYINHAHNDLLEILMDGGIAAVLLLGWALALLARDTWRVWQAKPSATVIQARAASLALGQVLIASLADYPLRTPLMSAVAVILIVWLRRGAIEGASANADRPSAPGSH